MTFRVSDLLVKSLREIGAEGLCGDDCGCQLDDLIPCGDDPSNCMPAIKQKDPIDIGDYDFVMQPMDWTP